MKTKREISEELNLSSKSCYLLKAFFLFECPNRRFLHNDAKGNLLASSCRKSDSGDWRTWDLISRVLMRNNFGLTSHIRRKIFNLRRCRGWLFFPVYIRCIERLRKPKKSTALLMLWLWLLHLVLPSSSTAKHSSPHTGAFAHFKLPRNDGILA